MSFPADEQIGQAIATQLATLTTANGYDIELADVIRPTRRPQLTPANMVAILQLDTYEQGDPETDSLGIKTHRTGVWIIDVFVEPSDDDATPYDQLRSQAIAEVERCLVEAMNANTRAFGGLGYNAELRAPQMLDAPEGGSAGIRVTLAVSYRYVDYDPYTILN
jgi:hypothetical protein